MSEEKKCYTCHNYHLPSGICQDLQEGKDPYDTCEEWTRIIGQTRYFAGLYPFEFLSINREDYPDAIEVYQPKLTTSSKGRKRWVFRTLLNDPNGKWMKNDIVLLPQGLMFRSIGSRTKNAIKQNETTKIVLQGIKELEEKGLI